MRAMAVDGVNSVRYRLGPPEIGGRGLLPAHRTLRVAVRSV